jgi:nucleotide-binding universal stress UspA family protein
MFRDILVPLDGSQFAEAALPLGSRLARAAQARLHLLLVHEPMGALIGMGDMVVPPPGLDAELKERERAYLAGTASALRQPDGRPVGFHETSGSAGPEICEEATRIDADLVVMATHGRGAFQRMWLGSVADYVVRHLTAPLLLVPPRGTESPPLEADLRDIVVALDLSQDAEAILEPVTALSRLTGAQLTLVHVVQLIFEIGRVTSTGPIVADSELLEASRLQAKRQLERLADRLRERDLKVDTRVVTGINPAGGLLETLSEDRYDLIALTTHGRTGLRRLLVGSVADKVIRAAAKPVLVLRPPLA